MSGSKSPVGGASPALAAMHLVEKHLRGCKLPRKMSKSVAACVEIILVEG
jgi:hypothetical protein